jgi:hypothetical protein
MAVKPSPPIPLYGSCIILKWILHIQYYHTSSDWLIASKIECKPGYILRLMSMSFLRAEKRPQTCRMAETFLTLFGEMGFPSEKMRDIICCQAIDKEKSPDISGLGVRYE